MQISFTKFTDESSTSLARYANTRIHHPKTVLEITQKINGKQVPIFEYELKNAIIDLYSIQAKSSKNKLIESIKLIAPIIEIKHFIYDKSGKLSKTKVRTLNN